MNAEVSYTGDTPNSLKEALERADEEVEARRQFLTRKYGRVAAEQMLTKSTIPRRAK